MKLLETNDDVELWTAQTVEKIKEQFPQVELRPFSEFKGYLDRIIPKLIHKYMLATQSMKVCSGISPDFAAIAADEGFPVVSVTRPGHMYNIALCSDGHYMVDLSVVQFQCKHDILDRDNREEVMDNYRELLNNPFKAIEVHKIASQPHRYARLPEVEKSPTFDPVARFKRYNPEMMEKGSAWFSKLRNIPHVPDDDDDIKEQMTVGDLRSLISEMLVIR